MRRLTRGLTADEEKDLLALENVSIEVAHGELFGLLGANGAGKTTLIKILTTLLAPTSGSAWVDGLDVVTEAPAVRPRINMVTGGESCGYGVLTVWENLWLFSQLYGVPGPIARQRIDRLLGVVGLTDRAGTKVSHLSTGMRQKMNFCRGFITDPKVLFLDEPTLGLDVTSARSIRQFLKEWLREDTARTILLTTHYLREADELCDRLAVIEGGRIVASDTPAALKRQIQRYPLFEITIAPPINGASDAPLPTVSAGQWPSVATLPGVHQCTVDAGPTVLALKVSLLEESAVGGVVQQLVGDGVHILSLRKVEPSLEDAFVELVGHGLSQEGEPT